MKNVYANFDGLDMSFHGRISEDVLVALSAAKVQAQELRNDAPATLGGMAVMVQESGRRGGYAFVFKTGEDGEVWAVMGTNEGQGRWMLHCSVGGGAFVQHGGLEAIRARIYQRLEALEFEPMECPKSGLVESVARVDFAMDFHADDFELCPENVASKGKKTGYFEGATAHWSGRRVTGCTIGKMPNRQVVIYDKTADIKAKQKDYYWQVWGLEPSPETRVWRVELRAGKRHLREVWGIKTFDDLAASVGDILADTLKKVRLIEPTDSNITRCPDAPLWRQCSIILYRALRDAFSGLCAGVVRQTTMDRFDNIMSALLRGVALTHASVLVGRADMPSILTRLRAVMNNAIHDVETDIENALEKAKRAQRRYQLLREEEWEKKNRHGVPDWLGGLERSPNGQTV